MHRMRPKIDKDGEIGALEYCALNETEGFTEVISYGLPELTAEAIVLRFPQAFSLAAREAGRKRLEDAGVCVDASGNITSGYHNRCGLADTCSETNTDDASTPDLSPRRCCVIAELVTIGASCS